MRTIGKQGSLRGAKQLYLSSYQHGRSDEANDQGCVVQIIVAWQIQELLWVLRFGPSRSALLFPTLRIAADRD